MTVRTLHIGRTANGDLGTGYRERGTGNREPETRNPRKGFTLVEVLVAIAILGVSLLAIVELRNDCVREIRQVIDTSDAWVLGTLAMGAVMTNETLDEGSDGGTFEEFPGYRWDVEKTTVMVDVVAEYFPGKDRATIPQKPKELLQVALVISLTDPPLERPPVLFRVVTFTPKRKPLAGPR
jgi:prepilin-type N-terminal cleavage/methylation domain-containing protein